MDKKGNNVRLTEEAHKLLAKRTKSSNISMKEVVSEAILLVFKQKRDNRNYAFSAFFLGTIAGGALMFFIGLLL